MIVKKCKIVNRVIRFIRVPYTPPCLSCERSRGGIYYCVSTYYGGNFVNIICKKANSKLQVFSYIPELWHVINKAL